MQTVSNLKHPDQAGMMILPWITLFPGAMLPLKIFEERYREMLRHALGGNRMFAIAHTAGEEFECEPIGSIGVVRACVSNDDGTSNLVLQGISRVEFQEILLDPHPHGIISVHSDPPATSPKLELLRRRIADVFKSQAVEKFGLPPGFVAHLDTLTLHGPFTDMVSSTVIDDPAQRRLLLEELDVTVRMEFLLEILSAKG